MAMGPAEAAGERAFEAMIGATRLGADAVQAEAVQSAPIKEGTLRGSATQREQRFGDTFSIDIIFPLVYAAVQHERTNFKHPMGGGPKYLEGPLKSYDSRIGKMQSAAVARVL